MQNLFLPEPSPPIDARPGDVLVCTDDDNGEQVVVLHDVCWDMVKLSVNIDGEVLTLWLTSEELTVMFDDEWHIEASE